MEYKPRNKRNVRRKPTLKQKLERENEALKHEAKLCRETLKFIITELNTTLARMENSNENKE